MKARLVVPRLLLVVLALGCDASSGWASDGRPRLLKSEDVDTFLKR
jgi:hypothetical protein